MSKLIVQAIINKVKEDNKGVLLGINDSALEVPAEQLKLEDAIKGYYKDNGSNAVWANALHRVMCSMFDVEYRDVVNHKSYPPQWALLKSRSGTKAATGMPVKDGTTMLICNATGYVFAGLDTGAWCLQSKQLEAPTKEEALAYVEQLEKLDASKFFTWFSVNIGVGALNNL